MSTNDIEERKNLILKGRQNARMIYDKVIPIKLKKWQNRLTYLNNLYAVTKNEEEKLKILKDIEEAKIEIDVYSV